MSDYINDIDALKKEVDKMKKMAEMWALLDYEYAVSLKRNGVSDISKYPINPVVESKMHYRSIPFDQDNTPIEDMLEICARTLKVSEPFHEDEQSVTFNSGFEFELEINPQKIYEGEYSYCECDLESANGVIVVKNHKLRSKEDYHRIYERKYFNKICNLSLQPFLKKRYGLDITIASNEINNLYFAKTDEDLKLFLEKVQLKLSEKMKVK
jgi:hypothetical protein